LKHYRFDDRLRIILSPSGPQRCSAALLKQPGELSQQYHLPIHTHVLEMKTQAFTGEAFYGKTLVRYLKDLGLLSDRLTLIHAVWLTDEDIDLLGEFGCSIVHNPLSNLKLGSGVAPIRKLLNAGVNVALGTDGTCTSDTPDLFAAIQCTSLLHKIGTHNYDEWIAATEVLPMATINGAKSSLMAKEVGSLEIGKKADVILLSRQHWGFIPFNHPIRQIAYSATSEAVQAVLINGKVVMRDRQILTLDEAALKSEIIAASERFQRDVFPVRRC
jgi:5-methylthioadenosine/S-adenosylhomocysteine deaminase